uniref:Uncharacterized protein n=1 Tax=Chrysemys picta bellii TaxID=8478 RepID=A0A8C3HTB1_CHRPI
MCTCIWVCVCVCIYIYIIENLCVCVCVWVQILNYTKAPLMLSKGPYLKKTKNPSWFSSRDFQMKDTVKSYGSL